MSNDTLTLATALEGAGHKPAPWIGQRWVDNRLTGLLPAGHRSIVTITSLGPTVSGWQARIVRKDFDQRGEQTWEGRGGDMHVRTLFEVCTPLPSQHLLYVEVDTSGRRLFRLQCSGVGDECRLYRAGICPDDCKPVPEMVGEDNWWDEDELVFAHGVVHRYCQGEWMAGTDTCFYATHPYLPDAASELVDPADGELLPTGRYPVAIFMEEGEFLHIELEEDK